MPTNMAVGRAGVHASAAAYTAQDILKRRAQYLRTTIVDNHQMERLRPVAFCVTTGARKPGVVAGQAGAHGAASQHGQHNVQFCK